MKTGTALERTGRNSLRKGARFLVAGFAVSTSGSRSSSAARRLTKVVLLWRMNGGSRRSVWSSASFWPAIAPKAVLALEIALESSLPRWATAVESLLELTTKRSSRPWSAFSSRVEGGGPVQRRAEVLEGLVGVLAAVRELFGVAADELAQGAAHRRREGVEELVEVDLGRGRAEAEGRAFVERRAAVRPGADRDVVVGDAGERGGADHRGGALVQFLFDADFDLGQVFVGEADAFDRADRLAADQHLVAGHELGGVLEDELVLVAATAAEEDDAEGDDDDRQGHDGRNSRGGDPPGFRRAFLLA